MMMMVKPEYVTVEACCPQGETLEELKEDFEIYQRALQAPVLNYEDFGKKQRNADQEREAS